jgi:flagellar basal body rod protein FlgB
MLRALFGPDSLTARLRGGLEELSATQRGIGRRVAGATDASTQTPFSEALARARGGQAPDLQQEMAALADTQLRYEAEARLLRDAYGRLRTAIRDRG